MNSATQTASKKPGVPMRRRHTVRYGLIVLVTALVGVQLGVDYLVFQNVYHPGDVSNISQIVVSGVEGSKQPIPVEASTGRQYIAPLRIVLPVDMTQQLGQLDYSYEPAKDGNAVLIQITDHSVVKAAESRLLLLDQKTSVWQSHDATVALEQVPVLQACSRGVYVFFDESGAKPYGQGLKSRGTRQLANGRMLHFYTEEPQRCIYTDFSSLITYLSKAESY